MKPGTNTNKPTKSPASTALSTLATLACLTLGLPLLLAGCGDEERGEHAVFASVGALDAGVSETMGMDLHEDDSTAPKEGQTSTGTSALTEMGCYIAQTICPNHPLAVGLFFDRSYASYDRSLCRGRAAEHREWCGMEPGQFSVALWFDGRRLTGLVRETGSGCYISQASCPNHPEQTGFFFDNSYASNDQTLCMQRADEYRTWCGMTYPQWSEAQYFDDDGEVVARQQSRGCFIEQEACPNHPDQVGFFFDNSYASTDRSLCMGRAAEYRAWCGMGPGQSSTAFFTGDGGVSRSSDLSAGCYIEQRVCPNHPDKVGFFLDDSYVNFPENRANAPELCKSRAQDYVDWCGMNPNQSSITTFYDEEGRVLTHQVASGAVR